MQLSNNKNQLVQHNCGIDFISVGGRATDSTGVKAVLENNIGDIEATKWRDHGSDTDVLIHRVLYVGVVRVAVAYSTMSLLRPNRTRPS